MTVFIREAKNERRSWNSLLNLSHISSLASNRINASRNSTEINSYASLTICTANHGTATTEHSGRLNGPLGSAFVYIALMTSALWGRRLVRLNLCRWRGPGNRWVTDDNQWTGTFEKLRSTRQFWIWMFGAQVPFQSTGFSQKENHSILLSQVIAIKDNVLRQQYVSLKWGNITGNNDYLS